MQERKFKNTPEILEINKDISKMATGETGGGPGAVEATNVVALSYEVIYAGSFKAPYLTEGSGNHVINLEQPFSRCYRAELRSAPFIRR